MKRNIGGIVQLRDNMRRIKTKKEIETRAKEIFDSAKGITLNDLERAKLNELEWVLGVWKPEENHSK
jgi:hypothetical protein